MFSFENLDATTRQFMVQEIELASSADNIYYSKRFNDRGKDLWVSLLKEAAQAHTEHWLTSQLETQKLMKETEGARTPSRRQTTKRVPFTAEETIAEGQFNRFYILGLCQRAKAEGKAQVLCYRAKERAEHRPESDALIGTNFPVDQLIAALRDCGTSLTHALLRPNSGLSVRLE